MRFSQRRGVALAELCPGGFVEVLRLKAVPDTAPAMGAHDIPVGDMLRLEKVVPRS
ncbi:MAG: hypothetical protein AAGC57_21755 [Pseudomonadota bacterium]